MATGSFHLEVLKLLLQVAWADFELQSEEAGVIRQLAGRYKLKEAELAELEGYLSGAAQLPAPDFELLRTRRTDVTLAVQTLMLSDLQFRREEREMIAQIEEMLG